MAAKIMLVEDDTNLSDIYKARLEAEGFTIITAADGEAALALAVKEHPDLIISDVMMPKISGFDMLDILRSTDGIKDTKVIMMTALGQAEDKARADKLGADRYLVKSQVTLEDVVTAVHQTLEDEDGAAASAVAAAGGTSSDATPKPGGDVSSALEPHEEAKVQSVPIATPPPDNEDSAKTEALSKIQDFVKDQEARSESPASTAPAVGTPPPEPPAAASNSDDDKDDDKKGDSVEIANKKIIRPIEKPSTSDKLMQAVAKEDDNAADKISIPVTMHDGQAAGPTDLPLAAPAPTAKLITPNGDTDKPNPDHIAL